MFFTLSRYGQVRLEVASDFGHQFVFQVVPRGKARRVTIRDADWHAGQRPENALNILRGALRFASRCAKDCGLA